MADISSAGITGASPGYRPDERFLCTARLSDGSYCVLPSSHAGSHENENRVPLEPAARGPAERLPARQTSERKEMSTPTGTPNDGSLSIITAKIINKIMDYEAGRLSDSQAVDLFQKLVDSGLAWQLEGHFARTARGLIDAGLVKDDERRVQNTRANIHFNYSSGGTAVNVYRHYDGYPEGPSGVLADLNRFFDDTEGQAGDTRFNDITFLAARFVVWEASRNCWRYAPDDHGRYVRVRKAPLDFDGVAVMIGDSPDAAYVYEVTETGADGGRPYVAWSTA